jgi:cysteine desulfurase/selenocysteine lyase
MHDITPELISRIATQLYQGHGVGSPTTQSPSQVDLTHAEFPEVPQQLSSVAPGRHSTLSPDSANAVPQWNQAEPQVPFNAVHGPAPRPPNGVDGFTTRPSIGSHGITPHPTGGASGLLSRPTGGSSGFTPSPAPTQAFSSAGNLDGLRNFVQQVSTTGIRDPRGGCLGREEDGLLQKLFTNSLNKSDSRPLDVNSIRKDFPILQQLIHGKQIAWLDNAATTQKPWPVIDAISRFYANDNSNIHRAAHTLAARATDAYEGARETVRRFLGAGSVKEIIFVRGTTEGINLVAQTYGRKFLQPGDEIILSTLEHHANIVPWQAIARERGAVIKVIPINDRGEIILEEYQALLGPRTKFVSLTQASNSLGTIVPVAEMIQSAKRYNARVLIDGAQTVAHIPTNVQELDCDFFVFSGHKIFGPTGIGAVFAKEELQELMHPWQGGGNMIRNVTFEETSFAGPPAKFEAGTPNIADAVGLAAALDYVTRLGLPNIAAYEHELLEYGAERLSHINGLRLIGTAREKVGVLSFVLKNKRVEEVGRLLDLEGIAVRAGHHCSQPSLRRFGLEATVRPSLAFYNTKEELDRLYEALRRIQTQ